MLFLSLRVVHPERMIEEGPLILAVNHSSYFDPPLAGICSRRAVYYLARKNLLEWPVLGPLFPSMNVIPVVRDGNDMSALREVIKKIGGGEWRATFSRGNPFQGRKPPTGASWHRTGDLQDDGSGCADAHFRRLPGISQGLARLASHEDYGGDWGAPPLQPGRSCSSKPRNVSTARRSGNGSNCGDQDGFLGICCDGNDLLRAGAVLREVRSGPS